MFNLEQAIMNWRRQMAARGIESVELLDELEGHLRDEIERQIQSGGDPECGFNTAVPRIGEPMVLAREFSKLKRGNRRLRFATRCCPIVSAFVLLINFWTLLEYELSWLESVLGLFSIILVCLYLVSLPRWVESFGSPGRLRMMKVCKGLVFPLLLWPIWEGLEAEHVVGSGLGIVPTMVVWCLYAAIAITSIVFSVGEASRPEDGSGGVSGLETEPAPNPPVSPAPQASGGSSPLSQRMDPHACEVLQVAHAEASRLGHDYIGTEHVLLGVIKSGTGASLQFLHRLGVDAECLQAEIERSVSGLSPRAEGEGLPLTPRARKALRLAAKEARKLKRSAIGPEHIFLGLLIEGSGVASQVLRRFGIRVQIARHEIIGKFGVGTAS